MRMCVCAGLSERRASPGGDGRSEHLLGGGGPEQEVSMDFQEAAIKLSQDWGRVGSSWRVLARPRGGIFRGALGHGAAEGGRPGSRLR